MARVRRAPLLGLPPSYRHCGCGAKHPSSIREQLLTLLIWVGSLAFVGAFVLAVCGQLAAALS